LSNPHGSLGNIRRVGINRYAGFGGIGHANRGIKGGIAPRFCDCYRGGSKLGGVCGGSYFDR
jgi:hypothetical protein